MMEWEMEGMGWNEGVVRVAVEEGKGQGRGLAGEKGDA